MVPRPRIAPIMLLAAVVTATGCNATQRMTSTPTERWMAGNASLVAAQDTIAFLAEHKLISDEDIVATEKYIKAARAALDEAEKQLTANPKGGQKFEDMMAVALAAIRELETKKEKVTNDPDD